MRWDSPKPRLGSSRVVYRFLMLPRTLQGETRWLEYVRIRQYYQNPDNPIPGVPMSSASRWVDTAWVSDLEDDDELEA